MRQRDGKLMVPHHEKSQTATREPIMRRLGTKPGVLVVDDEHMVRIMVQLGLERNGFEVWLASDGLEAIDLFRAHREEIAVVLLDVRMPGFDGVQTLDSLRELDREVPACFMNDDPGAYEPDELLQRGAAYVIAKPFHLDELANILGLLANHAPAEILPSGGVCQD
jgi:two-component system response regulator (stage 0 sporulation protein F)